MVDLGRDENMRGDKDVCRCARHQGCVCGCLGLPYMPSRFPFEKITFFLHFNDHIYIFFREAVWLCCTLKQSDVCNPRKLTDNTPRRLCIRRVQHERIS